MKILLVLVACIFTSDISLEVKRGTFDNLERVIKCAMGSPLSQEEISYLKGYMEYSDSDIRYMAEYHTINPK